MPIHETFLSEKGASFYCWLMNKIGIPVKLETEILDIPMKRIVLYKVFDGDAVRLMYDEYDMLDITDEELIERVNSSDKSPEEKRDLIETELARQGYVEALITKFRDRNFYLFLYSFTTLLILSICVSNVIFVLIAFTLAVLLYINFLRNSKKLFKIGVGLIQYFDKRLMFKGEVQ